MADRQVSEVRSSVRETGQEQRLFTFKAMQLIWLGVAVLEALIGLRVILKVFAANPDNAMASMLYGFTDLFLFPFAGLMPTPASGGMVLEVSSFVAMIVYALIGWGLAKLVEVVFYRPSSTVVAVTESTTSEQHLQ